MHLYNVHIYLFIVVTVQSSEEVSYNIAIRI